MPGVIHRTSQDAILEGGGARYSSLDSCPSPPLPSHSIHHRPIRPNSGGSRNLGAGPVRGPHREPIEGKMGDATAHQRGALDGLAVTCEGRSGQPWLVRYRVGQRRSRVRRRRRRRPEPGNKSTTQLNWVQRRAGWRQRGIAKVWFPPSAERRVRKDLGKTIEGSRRAKRRAARMRSNLLETGPGVQLDSMPRCWVVVCVLPFALLCVVHVVRATCMSVVVHSCES